MRSKRGIGLRLVAAAFVVATAIVGYRRGLSPRASAPPAPALPTSVAVSDLARPASSPVRTPPSATVSHQLQVLEQILREPAGDNDPRLDTELRDLSPEARVAMRERYRTLPAEQRNPRGTFVFLLGRHLDRPEDVAFLQQVVNEAPCLSLANCAQEARIGTGPQAHLESVSQVTLLYPQLMALRSVREYLRSRAEASGTGAAPDSQPAKDTSLNSAMDAAVAELIAEGLRSPVPMLARKAAELHSMRGER